ncbi:sirohydrochlorin ferrochelatase [Kribbella orskensis]|uniref:Sirohydrochlorin ferrochelatase n=1 Tax=Kribbella orskensis TaxID=2512216 RepID=A0ABY2BYC6_9ACTN|nr:MULTISPECIES: CbiX/SirB N-terminal domain-containing protein [Kribbella]TCN44114.1 sirohydrochlorin ferrochelatase [Kribbella sp. VKM Ac-2500]TCO32108.1 sirohydrochlorin ferrochelatase [Kribbella orskensis]
MTAAVGGVDLIAAAHGTADPRGIRTIHALVRLMAAQRPEMPISLGFVDVDVPALPSLVDRVVADSNQAVVVPLLLSSGYHVAVDVLGEVARRPGQVQAAAALGPDPLLAEVLADRLRESLDPRSVGLEEIDQVVLAAAGSSDRRALLDCSATAAMLSALIDRPVEVGYVSGAGERLAPVLARTTGPAARGTGRVAVATYMLAPGFFADRVRRIAGDLPVSAPLGADPRVAGLALARYDAARVLSAVAV